VSMRGWTGWNNWTSTCPETIVLHTVGKVVRSKRPAGDHAHRAGLIAFRKVSLLVLLDATQEPA